MERQRENSRFSHLTKRQQALLVLTVVVGAGVACQMLETGAPVETMTPTTQPINTDIPRETPTIIQSTPDLSTPTSVLPESSPEPISTYPEEVQTLVDARNLTEITNDETGQRELVTENGRVWFVDQDNNEWQQLLFELDVENRLFYTNGEQIDLGMTSVMEGYIFSDVTIFGVVSQEPVLGEDGNWRVKMLTVPMGWSEADGLPEIELVLPSSPLQMWPVIAEDFELKIPWRPKPDEFVEYFTDVLRIGDQVGFIVAIYPKPLPADIRWGNDYGEIFYYLVASHSNESHAVIEALLNGEIPPNEELWGGDVIIFGTLGT